MKRKTKTKIIIAVCVLFALTLPMIFKNNSERENNFVSLQTYGNLISNSNLKTSAQIPYIMQWLRNSQFSTDEFWNLTIDTDSPLADVAGRIENGNAKIDIIGEQYTYNKSWNLTNVQNQTDWELDLQPKWAYYDPNIDPNDIYPDFKEKNSSGLCASHYWDEGADQIAVVNWNYTINLDQNMADYNITSASLAATFYANVQATVSEDEGGSNEFTGAIDVLTDEFIDSGVNDSNGQPFQGQTGDFARFFVLVSDTEYTNSKEVAHYQSSTLGQDIPEINEISNGLMVTESEVELISDINTALKNNYKNFTISLGIYIKCEDNFAQDADNWTLLALTGFNFSFSYEKIINKETTISWSQTGTAITGQNLVITGANLGFDYKLNSNWTEASPFSELKIFINNNEHSTSILLGEYVHTGNFISVGFDLTSIIPRDENITFSLQLYLANRFDLTDNITISFDNVFLQISYIQIYPDIGVSEGIDEPWIYAGLFIAAAAVAGGLGTYLFLYYTIFRYPKPIRKLRKYRKSLKKANVPRSIQVPSRERAFKDKI